MNYQEQINALDELSFKVTQEKATEAPFTNKYYDHFEKGLYLDVISKIPLFASTHKFECSCGWPSFYSEINKNELQLVDDFSLGMHRIEVVAKSSGSHLGHLFNDGLAIYDYKRYCINSASLSFISYDDLDDAGYGSYKYLFK